MVDYNLNFVDSPPDPFSNTDETDHRRIENYHHVAEMSTVIGDDYVQYGGDHPWIHMWKGVIPNPDDINALELSSDATTKERIKHEIDRLVTFLVSNSLTPHKTTVNDFEWEVYTSENNGGYTVAVIWRPR